MLDIFSGLRLVIKRRHTSIDNAIFRCHWFLTSTILISFSLIITARQYVGQPIECHSTDKIPDSMLNSYCWVQSTFTIPSACSSKLLIGVDVPYPCVDGTRGRDTKVFAYYQWVGIVLFVQGVLFHLPYYLWKVWECGLIKAITGGLRNAVCSESERRRKRDIVIEYLYEHLGCHRKYAIKYFVCELCCLLNLLTQLWATNKFFDGHFLSYGLDVLQSSSISSTLSSTTSTLKQKTASNNMRNQRSQHNSTDTKNNITNNSDFRVDDTLDPMIYVFPRMTKCTYYDFGSSGDVQKHDALCLLPLNIVNEKIYFSLWFWFIILAMLTIFVIMYRICAFIFPIVRCKGLASRCKFSRQREIGIICAACDIGDWFLLYMVAENLDPLIMREIIAAVAFRIECDVLSDSKKLEAEIAAECCKCKGDEQSILPIDDKLKEKEEDDNGSSALESSPMTSSFSSLDNLCQHKNKARRIQATNASKTDMRESIKVDLERLLASTQSTRRFSYATADYAALRRSLLATSLPRGKLSANRKCIKHQNQELSEEFEPKRNFVGKLMKIIPFNDDRRRQSPFGFKRQNETYVRKGSDNPLVKRDDYELASVVVDSGSNQQQQKSALISS